MYRYRSLIFSFLICIIVASAGFFCIKHCISGRTAEERQALTETASVGFGFTGLLALALSTLTYFFLVRSEKLKMHVKKLTESNQRLGEEIIQRKAAEEKLANMADEWARTFDSIPDLISIHSNDLRIIRANQALADFLGVSKEEITGKFCYEVFHGTKGPVAVCPHVRTMETKYPVTAELRGLKNACHSMVSTSPIFNKQHEVIGTIHIVKDTSKMKKFEEQLRQAQKMESVGQLAGGVAHDFNNILASIINYNYIMRDMAPGDPDYLNIIDKISSLTDRASHLTRSLLTYSRKQFFELKPLSINSILKNIDQLLRTLIDEKIELVTHTAEDDLVIMANENQIGQCLLNLASNARDAMPDGGSLTIKTEAMKIDDDFILSHGFGIAGAYALISVTDTGTGMDEKTMLKIFDPFFTTKEVGKGTGLGLSMVFGIMKLHEGYIDVDSKPGHGTTFKLYFPLIKKINGTKKQDEYTPMTGDTKNI